MTFKTIQPEQFKEQVNWASDTVVDVRSPAEYQDQHLAGATNLPLDELTAEQLSQQGGKRTFLVCQAGKRAEKAAQKMAGHFEGELIVVGGGTEACVELGMTCNQGKKHLSLERQVRIAAGSLVLLGVILASTVDSNFIALSGFVGAGLVFAGVTNTCGMGLLIARMPWNTK